MNSFSFFDRDISWLSFNERVLLEATKEQVPLMERIKFLSIYSSNLDEFYRVRIPGILALQKLRKETSVYQQVAEIINRQQNLFGSILTQTLIPALKNEGFHFMYNEEIPAELLPAINNYFFNNVAGFIQPALLDEKVSFFPENNQLYVAVTVQYKDDDRLYLVNIPVNNVSRFFKISTAEGLYIIFLEDIIKLNLQHLFPSGVVEGSYNIKITRDAELDLQDEYDGDVADKIEKQLSKRDAGLATRFLYEPGIPLRHLHKIIQAFNLHKASIIEGGRHHNLKDLAQLPVSFPGSSFPDWPAANAMTISAPETTLFREIAARDRIVHVPYQSYDTILRFFNEAAIDETVTEIYTTLYRVASDSRIVFALISAAMNGKKVSVVVELKARFDEANNIRWAKKMKAAGVRIIYSINALKVHAKIALVKRENDILPYLGLLATGNLNESTARFYTDHILLTAHQPMLAEMEKLFLFLRKRKKPEPEDAIDFKHLLVAQFNLLPAFIGKIDREISNAKAGSPAAITIKLNNLEEDSLITKLYEASNAGVTINLIIRGICRLVPGLAGQSEHIRVIRIVDRYLEHGRVFIFHNNGQKEIYLGSADWMNRNIYRRVEVCFPVYDETVKKQIVEIITLQLNDTIQAVFIGQEGDNEKIPESEQGVRSQEAIYRLLV